MSGLIPSCPCGQAPANGVYRQCALKDCSLELARCHEHGGDDAAMLAMQAHMEDVHGRPGPKAAAAARATELALIRQAMGLP